MWAQGPTLTRLADGAIRQGMSAYFDDKDLPHFKDLAVHAPELWAKFEAYYGAAFEAGELSKREKLLIGFAVAQTSQCPYCVDSFTRQCLQPG